MWIGLCRLLCGRGGFGGLGCRLALRLLVFCLGLGWVYVRGVGGRTSWKGVTVIVVLLFEIVVCDGSLFGRLDAK